MSSWRIDDAEVRIEGLFGFLQRVLPAALANLAFFAKRQGSAIRG